MPLMPTDNDAETLFRPVPSFNGRLNRPLEFVRRADVVAGLRCEEEEYSSKKFSCTAWEIPLSEQVSIVSSAQQPVSS